MKLTALFSEALEHSSPYVHIISVGTKPDIIKQAPVFHALKRRGMNVIVAHTGQHYDFNLSGGMIKELGVEPAVNFEIRGSGHEKIATIWTSVGEMIDRIETAQKIPVFYVHGDTTTASQIGAASYAKRYPVVHVEAGIRAFNPKVDFLQAIHDNEILDWNWFYSAMQDQSNFEIGSMEPYPEQFNTRVAATTAGIHIAPDEIAAENIRSEGHRDHHVYTLGNSIADITRETMKKAEHSTIFETYPLLKDGFIRFCIHRSENCEDQDRFIALFEAIEHFANNGEIILLIVMNKMRSALERYHLEDRLKRLEQMPNVIVSDVWPYYTDVIAAMQKAKLCVTDSGSMQEEMHLMRIPCVTTRFGTDRPETVFVGSNVIAPPSSAETVIRVIEAALQHLDDLASPTKELYGRNVSDQIATVVDKVLQKEISLFRDDARHHHLSQRE